MLIATPTRFSGDQITGRDGYVWWSTGGGDYVTWHKLDLHTLQPRTTA